MFIISLVAQKGGTGKTTLARCLAVAFERGGYAAAILDLDPQASAAIWGKRRTNENPEVIPTVLPLLDDALAAAKSAVDVVLIDSSPKSADVAIAAIKAADLVLIPCRPQIDDIETLPATKNLLDISGQTPAYVFLNSVPHYEPRVIEAAESIANHPTSPFQVCPNQFGNRAAFGDASMLGQTPQEYEPKGKASLEIELVYKWVCKIMSIKTKKRGSR